MNFIEQTCNQIVEPPKLKYSTMDLGTAVVKQDTRSLLMAADTISKPATFSPKN